MTRALLIGIDSYQTFPKLLGCMNDAVALSPLFSKHSDGSPNFSCNALLSSRGPVGRRDIVTAINTTLGTKSDVALIYFAECFGAWDQRPTFKANLEESFKLRRTVP